MHNTGECSGRVVGIRQYVKDGLDRASCFILAQTLPRLASATEGCRRVKLDAVGIARVDVLRQLIQPLCDPVHLRLEHGDSAKNQVLFVGVADGAGIVEVQEMHRVARR